MAKLTAVIERYFNHPERTITLPSGSILLAQNGYNDRLYYLRSGHVSGFFPKKGSAELKCFLLLPVHLLGCTVFSPVCGRRHQP